MNNIKTHIPLNVSSPLRACRNVGSSPLWVVRSEGEFLFDEDGKKYIDFMYAFGPIILGYNYPSINVAIKRQVDKGILFGSASQPEQELASLIVNSTESIEKIRFVNSGTESVMSAVRLARAYTCRAKVLTFAGGYHGHSDLFIGGDAASAGIDPAIRNAKDQCQYNSIDRVADLLKTRQFACVIIEPIACNMSLVLPNIDFLKKLRQLCDETGTTLIYDEVISGFRYCFGSVANQLGVHADLYTFGKIIGGGTAIGAFAGSSDYFDLLEKQQVLQGGTFSGNPLSMAAGVAALHALKDTNIYDKLAEKSDYLESKFNSSKLPEKICLVRYLSTFAFQFSRKPATHYEEAKVNGQTEYGHIFRICREYGINLPPDYLEPMHLSLASSYQSIDKLIETIELSMSEWR